MNIKLQVRYEAHPCGMFAVADVGLTKLNGFGATQEEALSRLTENVRGFMAVQEHMPQPHEIEVRIPDAPRVIDITPAYAERVVMTV